MATQIEIQNYIACRDESELENKMFFRSATYWSNLSLSQKKAEAVRKLELEEADLSNCPDCGCQDIDVQDGFPGETFWVCPRCGKIIASDFDYSSIE